MNTEAKLVQAMSGLVSIQQYLVGLPERETIGQQILKSDNFQKFVAKNSDLLTLNLAPRELKTAITSTGTVNDPLAGSLLPTIDPGTRRALTIRDLLPAFPTVNGAIEMPVKSAATNNAAVQTTGSPEARENVAFGESAYTFTTSFVPVETLGHFIPISSQIFEDAGTLDGLINTELLYGLGLAVEDQLLNGTGANGQLDGLLQGATAWANESPNITNEVDIIRSAAKQMAVADFHATAVVLNPGDWYDIETRKASGSDDTYAAGAPRQHGTPTLWGLPVVESNSIASGTFLCGDFNRAGILFERDTASVEIARHDGTNFQKGMLTIRATERLALVITNPLGLITGAL